ncbi:MAG: hypothetical protein IPO71_02355 [Nitrosomonas sp.]|nr:hypothetical protein [Nitrosomonas sp.]
MNIARIGIDLAKRFQIHGVVERRRYWYAGIAPIADAGLFQQLTPCLIGMGLTGRANWANGRSVAPRL